MSPPPSESPEEKQPPVDVQRANAQLLIKNAFGFTDATGESDDRLFKDPFILDHQKRDIDFKNINYLLEVPNSRRYKNRVSSWAKAHLARGNFSKNDNGVLLLNGKVCVPHSLRTLYMDNFHRQLFHDGAQRTQCIAAEIYLEWYAT